MPPSKPRSAALLDLHALRGDYRQDESMGVLAARLEASGHRVAFVRSAAGDDPEWLARVTDFVREGAFDFVVLPRLWDAAVAAALRAALGPGGLVVRLSSGVSAALDHELDHVLDADGVLRLAGGDDAPAKAAYRPMLPAELRRHAATARAYPPVREATSLAGDTAPLSRPTIAGPPAGGCPFLLDARKNPHFADLDLDPDKVQVRGCTFCLDNTGSYAAPSEEAVLDAWLSRLRRLREKTKVGLLEVLLTDERPHPHLPALFRAIAAEPGLAPIDLMWKSRVDWLLEFADTSVAEACALAEQTGSVVHLYLVGFESFHQADLDRFNKAQTVADNVEAAAVMRRLAERFPTSFVYNKYKTHGIVLYTPWTTPESLLDNARWMRACRFHELRTECLKTRLRLYPRVPLYALAERAGLLEASFGLSRPDRAAEQGYDASAPWRFADARIDAIFQLALDLQRLDHRTPEADVLEVATRYVTRWPGLAAAPDAALLPLRQALRTLGVPPFIALSGLGRAAFGVDPEIDAIARGERRACLKEGVAKADEAALVRAYRAMGFAADVVSHHGLSRGGDEHRRGDDFAIVAVAEDAAALSSLLSAQLRVSAGEGVSAVREAGALLGYPKCCADAFAERSGQGDNLENERAAFLRAPDEALHPLLHRVGLVRLISHFPCTPACAASVRVAEQVLAGLAELDEEAARWVSSQLERATLLLDYDRRVQLEGAWEGDRYRVTRAMVLGDPKKLGVDAGNMAAIEVTSEGARVVLRSRGTFDLSASRPILAIPGQPMPAPVLAALRPRPAGP